MTSSQNSRTPPPPKPSQFAPGDEVITPSGRVADVVNVYPETEEVLVQWFDGDRARFKFGLLRRVPAKEE
jgi:preprotein translocase subunit YajC